VRPGGRLRAGRAGKRPISSNVDARRRRIASQVVPASLRSEGTMFKRRKRAPGERQGWAKRLSGMVAGVAGGLPFWRKRKATITGAGTPGEVSGSARLQCRLAALVAWPPITPAANTTIANAGIVPLRPTGWTDPRIPPRRSTNRLLKHSGRFVCARSRSSHRCRSPRSRAEQAA
jgi:hypothetical protein